MKLENLVCSFEHSKRLKELGIIQESIFYWGKDFIDIHEYRYILTQREGDALFLKPGRLFGRLKTSDVSTFTSAELGEMIGHRCVSFKTKNRWFCGLAYPEGTKIYTPSADSEADSRAAALIYFVEEGIVKL